MTRFIIAVGIATTIAAFGGTARADMGIPNIPAQPLITQTAPGVVTEAMPSFVGVTQPVVTERFAQNVLSGAMPSFIAPTENGSGGVAYAQIGRVRSTAPTALAKNGSRKKVSG